MKKTWILVATSSSARVFEATDNHTLNEKTTLIHPESEMLAQDLVSDRKGTNNPRIAPGQTAYQERTPQKVKQRNIFADQIAQYLDKGFYAKEFEKLYLIVAPPFLGYLRDAISPNVDKTVVLEIQKDLVTHRPEEIRSYLPEVL